MVRGESAADATVWAPSRGETNRPGRYLFPLEPLQRRLGMHCAQRLRCTIS
jgi:hypothetical protein